MVLALMKFSAADLISLVNSVKSQSFEEESYSEDCKKANGSDSYSEGIIEIHNDETTQKSLSLQLQPSREMEWNLTRIESNSES